MVIPQNKIWTFILLAMLNTAFFSERAWGQGGKGGDDNLSSIDPTIQKLVVVNPDKTLTYTIKICSPTGHPSWNFTISDNLPQELTILSADLQFVQTGTIGAFNLTLNLSGSQFIVPPAQCFSYSYTCSVDSSSVFFCPIRNCVSMDIREKGAIVGHIESCAKINSPFPTNSVVVGADQNSVTKLSSLIPPLSNILPASSYSGRISVNGILIIDKDYELNSADILMNAGAGIDIEPENTFKTYNSHFFGCDTMWRSIRVNKYSHLEAMWTWIEDANRAIEVITDPVNVETSDTLFVEPDTRPFFNSITLLLVQNCYFNSNYSSLYAYGSFSTNGNIIGNSFVRGNLKNAYIGQPNIIGFKPMCGIFLLKSGTVNIGNFTGSKNKFNGLSAGIVARECKVRINNCNFLDIQPDITYDYLLNDAFQFGNGCAILGQEKNHVFFTPYSRFDIGGVNIQSCRLGIRCTGFELVAKQNIINNCLLGIEQIAGAYHVPFAIIEQNSVTNAQVGIGLTNCRSIDICKNYITALGVYSAGIRVANFFFTGNAHQGGKGICDNDIKCYSLLGRGIESQGVSCLNILDNTIQMYDQTPYFGLSITTSWYDKVRNNNITGVGYTNAELPNNDPPKSIGIYSGGINMSDFFCNHIENMQVGMEFIAENMTTNIRGNEMSKHYIGLLYDKSTVINEQNYQGNKWQPNTFSSGFGAVSRVESAILINQQKYKVVGNTPNTIFFPTFSTPNIPTSTAWFLGNTNNNNVPCPSTNDDGFTDNQGLSALDEMIAAGTLVQASDEGTSKHYELRKYLYKKLTLQPQLLATSSPNIQNFYAFWASKSVGKFSDIEILAQNLINAESSQYKVLNSLQEQLSNNKELSDSLQLTLNKTIEDNKKALLNQQLKELNTLYESMQVQMNNLGNELKQKVITNADILTSLNAAIPATEIFELNDKNINAVYFQTFIREIHSFDAAQKSMLLSIAAQCPKIGGNAVYYARAACGLFQNIPFENCCVIERSDKIENILPTTSTPSLKFLPNPSDGYVEVQLPQFSTPVKCLVVNSQGQIVNSQDLQTNDNFYISTSTWSNGIYFIKIYSALDSRVLVEKLIVQH